MKTLLIDNYDSFTYNLYHALAVVTGVEPLVIRNDVLTLAQIRALPVDQVVISPGPGRPECGRDFGVCAEVMAHLELPVLGVCLGCQGLGVSFGATVVAAPEPMHGRLSRIYHDGEGLFAGLPQGFAAVRYHSLIVRAEGLPADLVRTAWTVDGLIMGLRHRHRPRWGVQFHPESICTEAGLSLLENFCALSRREPRTARAPARAVEVRLAPPERTLSPSAPSEDWEVRWRRVERLPSAEAVFRAWYANKREAFWLDSSLVAEGLSRFSYLGAAGGPTALRVSARAGTGRVTVESPSGIRECVGDIFTVLEALRRERACTDGGLPFDFQGGFVGYLGYELKVDCGATAAHRSALPDAVFLFADQLIVFDHAAGGAYLVSAAPRAGRTAADAWLETTASALAALPVDTSPAAPARAAPALTVSSPRDAASYARDVVTCQRWLAEGESYELCLTTQLHVSGAVDPVAVYLDLRRRNPAPQAAWLRLDDVTVLSSSPERFLRVDRERVLESRPIKGTARRGRDAAEDAELVQALRDSEKNRAEHLMIVDLMRNDLGRVCAVGTVAVPTLMAIETYATVHQMVSTVRGRLLPGVPALEAVRQAFPAGSMTGAPKLRTMELLDRLEPEARGVYAGALGYVGLNGTLDLSVVIRTLVVTSAGATIGTGGAIVAQSVAADEWAELQLKARALLDVLGVC